MEKGVYGPAFGIFRSFLQQHASTRKENCYFLLILVSQYISQLGLLQNICYQGYMQMVQHQTICSRTPFSNCTGCTLRRGARQDWPSISIFPPPFYIKHQDFGAHWARKAQQGQVSPRSWIDRMACACSVVVGHVKLPTIPNDLMMLMGRLYQDA